MIMEAARDYVQTKLEPRALKGNHEEHFDIEIAREMGELGLLGATLPEEFGGAGADYIAYGCVQRELDRVDSGYGTFFGAQSTLVMYPIFEFGTDETVLPWHAKSQCRRNRREESNPGLPYGIAPISVARPSERNPLRFHQSTLCLAALACICLVLALRRSTDRAAGHPQRFLLPFRQAEVE